MPASRLRLKLAASFALAIVLGLIVVDLLLYTLLSRQLDARLTTDLRAVAAGVWQAVDRERAEPGSTPLSEAATEALAEWPAGPGAIQIRAADGAVVARQGDAALLALLPLGPLPPAAATRDLPFTPEGGARMAVFPSPDGAVTVMAIRSLAPLREDRELLATWLLVSIALVLLLALPCGYLLAGRALAPFRALATEVQAMRPGQLDRRLPVTPVPDEVDHLAIEVNHLLDRLQAAQQHTRTFLAQAAHQLRTPLTLIRGESDLAIERDRPAADYRSALHRVSRAAGQMTGRVDDLLLLARAESGERIAAREPVELDAVALEAVDLMRGRAQGLERQLSLGTMDGVEVEGDESLLREAALELLENACRYSEVGPIEVAVRADGADAFLEVRSAGPPAPAAADSTGLGLAIVTWIAQVHDGALVQQADAGKNAYVLRLPRRPGTPG